MEDEERVAESRFLRLNDVSRCANVMVATFKFVDCFIEDFPYFSEYASRIRERGWD